MVWINSPAQGRNDDANSVARGWPESRLRQTKVAKTLGVENSKNTGENPRKMEGNARVYFVPHISCHAARSGRLTICGLGGVHLGYI